jgi:putative transposase
MSRPHRLDSRSYVGFRRYYLTICTSGRRRSFTSAEAVRRTVLQFLRVAAGESFEILAYCFMPDHIHVLAVATSAAADLQRFVRLAKQRSGFAFARTAGHPLWQESYFERVVREDRDLAGLIAYIVQNPVRAGLTRTAVDYPFWGSQVYSREEILEFLAAARRV